MAEIVNLRRVKKAKARAEKSREADANRTRHGTPKAIRDLAKARDEKAAHDLDARRLDRDKDGA
ncbi:MAG: DUF4169 family protein [Rhizomicrobium sp.]